MAALLYWAGIFALGMVLGTVRTLWLVPLLGELAAVACELPIMLGASWLWARRLVVRWRVRAGAPALAMGLSAFLLLMASELALGLLAFGQTPGQWLAGLGRAPGLLGLAGQVLFALLPWLAARGEKSPSASPPIG